MKLLRCAICVLVVAICQVRAQEEDVDERVDDFKPTLDDDMIQYTQKFSFKLGFRDISGAKSSFAGSGKIAASTSIGDTTSVMERKYHDGTVYLDTRVVVDPSGRSVAMESDGKTNNWSYLLESQAAINGIIALHSYSADLTDPLHEKSPGSNLGVDISIEREMGKLFHGKWKWGLIGGVSINTISSSSTQAVTAKLTTITDYYSLFGQAAPTAPYSGPTYSGSVDSSTLLGNTPLARDTTITTTNALVSNTSRLKGAYLTFRAGPTLFMPITEKFSGTFSAGLALVYSGSTYEVTESFLPATGDAVIDVIRDGQSNLLPGFYADANLLYTVNDIAGLYLGAVYQNTGTYEQKITDSAGDSFYTTHVDLSHLQGIRAGVSFKF